MVRQLRRTLNAQCTQSKWLKVPLVGLLYTIAWKIPILNRGLSATLVYPSIIVRSAQRRPNISGVAPAPYCHYTQVRSGLSPVSTI